MFSSLDLMLLLGGLGVALVLASTYALVIRAAARPGGFGRARFEPHAAEQLAYQPVATH